MKVGCLTILDGTERGKQILLKNLSVFEAGKAQGNHICLKDDSVAFNHFRIYCSEKNYLVYDLGSKRGTLLNGERIEKSEIHSGDELQVGDVKIRFDLVDDAQAVGRLASSAPDSNEEDAQAKVGGIITKTARSMPAIVVIDGSDRGRRLTLGGKKSFDIGRSPKTDLHLTDNKVSRRHCQIVEDGDHHVIIDLESSNGTVVNGDRVKQARLREGDFIRLGFTMLKYDRV
ncbi:MAG: FHA domain-containing protein [Planctomycetes bacterium]|nr:FHA domain-containing protein [Planctomycetota bacterium]